MKKWRCIVWCRDCFGNDSLGCFDGGSEIIGEYDTKEEAEKAGEDYIKDTIYEYEVTESEKPRLRRGE